MTLTDIPYGEVTRPDNGLQNLDKGLADIVTFELEPFLEKVWNVTKGTIIIFCGKEQVSSIHKWFAEKQQKKLGTVRQLIRQKSNPSPMNGQYVYLSGIENAIWFRKGAEHLILIVRILFLCILWEVLNSTLLKKIINF